MSTNQIELEPVGRRLYVRGNSFPIKDAIKGAGGHWDADERAWWIGAGKREEIQRAIDRASASQEARATGTAMKVIGKAKYKGRVYFVAWAGRTKQGTGPYSMKLVFTDGSKDFWAEALEHGTGPDEIAAWVKRYQEPRTIQSVLDYAKKMRQGGGTVASTSRRGYTGYPRECSTCRAKGDWCDRCYFDEFDC